MIKVHMMESAQGPRLITAAGEVKRVFPKNGKHFSLEELQGYVGGYIEVLRPPSKINAVLVINEEGKLIGLPFNDIASRMWQEGCEVGSPRYFDTVVGDVLLCRESDLE